MRKHHYKSNCIYHIVICTKYKHPVLKDNIKSFLDEKIKEVCLAYGYDIMDFSIEPEHVHLVLKLQPTYSVGSVLRNLKSITGFYLFKEFPEMRHQYFWKNGFWSHGYFISTIGNVSKENILEYIQSQEHYND